jgi:predicted transcriptional regulator of viral defense system
LAAALLGGPGAAVSHAAAGALHRIRRTWPRRVDVTIPRERRSRPGILFHCCRLPADEVTVVAGIPVTTVTRTIFDLAGTLHRKEVESAMHEADIRRLTDHLSLPELVQRHPGRRGVGTIRSILADQAEGQSATRSELEARFAAFCDLRGLPRPAINAPVMLADGTWIEVDCMWRKQRVILELEWSRHPCHEAQVRA